MKQWLLGIFLFACTACASANTGTLVLDAAHTNWPISLANYLQIFEDTSAQRNLDDVADLPTDAPHGFRQATPDTLQPGYSKSAWWLQLRIANNEAAPQALRLLPGSLNLDRLDLFIQHGNRWTHSQAGDKIAISRSNIEATRLHALAFQLEPGEQVRVMIRMQSDKTLRLLPSLYSEPVYQATENRLSIWDGILFGGILTIGWCALLIALYSPSLRFVLLSVLSVNIALYEASIRGYTKLYLWPESVEWASRSPKVLGYLSLAIFTAFILRMAKRENISWPGHRYFVALAVTQAAMAAAALLADLNWISRLGTFTTLLYGISQPIAAFLLLRRATPTGKLMLLVGGFFFLQTVFRIMERAGLLPDFAISLGLGNVDYNPVLALMGLAVNLAVLTAWMLLIGKQRKAAYDALADWQELEQERLKGEIARRTAALNKALHYAHEKNRQKTETLGYISHDLRAPLATILGYIRLLGETQTAEQAPHVRAIERSASYQLTLIDELLEYAKNELQPLEIKPEAIGVAALLDDITQYATALSAQQRNRFECKAATPLPSKVFLDVRRLQQILLNLISNAAKFTHNGVITLSIGAEGSPENPTLSFAVADSGIGIDIQAQSMVFNAFEQLKAQPGSTGLGLFIAERIVENMGGQLMLESTPGVGSRFSFAIRVKAMGTETTTWRAPIFSATDIAATSGGHSSTGPMAPPAHARLDLAKFADDGQLTDIEKWLHRMSRSHPAYSAYLNNVRDALQTLDFDRIKTLALSNPQ